MHRQIFEIGFIRSTLSKNQPNIKKHFYTLDVLPVNRPTVSQCTERKSASLVFAENTATVVQTECHARFLYLRLQVPKSQATSDNFVDGGNGHYRQAHPVDDFQPHSGLQRTSLEARLCFDVNTGLQRLGTNQSV